MEQKVFFCIATFFKGEDFLIECKNQGNYVVLLTDERHKDENWPHDSIDEIYYLKADEEGNHNFENMAKGFAYFFRKKVVDVIIALDDFDVEKAAYLREEFRVSGMGQTTYRYFRDKLAMRYKAQSENILVPGFTHLFNDDVINTFIREYPGPWLIKPRAEASSLGIQKVYNSEEFWNKVHELGDIRYNYLAEQFFEGDVFHVDTLTYQGQIVFKCISKYLETPFEIAHQGGLFRSKTLHPKSADAKVLGDITQDLMKAYGMQASASHSEWIKSKDDNEFYLIETSSRVGGAHLADMIEVCTGINLWKEWAKLESSIVKSELYSPPKTKFTPSCIIISLIKDYVPDMTPFTDQGILWTLDRPHHIGMVLSNQDEEKLMELVGRYTEIIANDYNAFAPAKDKPEH